MHPPSGCEYMVKKNSQQIYDLFSVAPIFGLSKVFISWSILNIWEYFSVTDQFGAVYENNMLNIMPDISET